jgi:hypothetical protein
MNVTPVRLFLRLGWKSGADTQGGEGNGENRSPLHRLALVLDVALNRSFTGFSPVGIHEPTLTIQRPAKPVRGNGRHG